MARRRSSTPRSAGAVLEKLHATLAGGWKPGLTVLTGEDRFHLDAARTALLKHLAPEEESDLALTVLGEGRVDVADVVAAARSKPMFAERRVVFVREVEILEGKPEPLVAYAKKPPADSYLVVRAPKLDRRRPLHKALLAEGVVLEFAAPRYPDPRSMSRAVVQMAAHKELKLDREVAALLADVCAGDLYRVGTELDKLDVWLGSTAGRQVRLEDAREIVFGGGALTGWEIADAVQDRDLPSALGAVRRLVAAGDEPLRILGGLAWRSRTLLAGKAMLAAGMSAHQVAAAVRAWPKDRFIEGLKRYSLAELMTFPSRLLQADRCLKSRKLAGLTVVETLVRELIEPAPAEGSR